VFGWLAKKKQLPREIEDPVFGRLTWIPASSSWDGKVRFSAIDADVFVSISAKEDEPGPGESQHTVFQHILEKYAELISAVTPLLRREYDAAREVDDSLPPDVPFRLEELSIPESESDLMKWEMCFYCDDGGDCNYVVYLKGWQPTGEIFVWD
jgi:hypothetical protein